MSDKDLQVELIPTGDLVPYARNSRKHSDKQITQIKSSIREFGFTVPILVDEENTVLAGHARLEAAKRLKMGKVPCVRKSDMTKHQKRAYVIADNQLAQNSEWDDELIEVELSELHESDFDMDKLGFDPDELASLMRLGESDISETDDDDFFEYDDVADDDGGLEEPNPSKCDDGYTEFALVLQKPNKERLLAVLNEVKNEIDSDSNEEALMLLLDIYQGGHDAENS